MVEVSPVEVAVEAFEFAGIVLPPSATVLGGRIDKGIDILYGVSISVSPEEFPILIDQSDFKGAFHQDRPPFLEIFGGADLERLPLVLMAHDDWNSPDGRRVGRDIVVDQRDKSLWYVHFRLF